METDKKLGPTPKVRVCYVCGRQYGLSSYEIHLKQCKELWISRENTKPVKERKPLPEDPFFNESFDDSNQISLEKINEIASSTFNTVSLSTCEFCGRTFLPEKLLIHNRSCTAETPAKRVSKQENTSSLPPLVSSNISPAKKTNISNQSTHVSQLAVPGPSRSPQIDLFPPMSSLRLDQLEGRVRAMEELANELLKEAALARECIRELRKGGEKPSHEGEEIKSVTSNSTNTTQPTG